MHVIGVAQSLGLFFVVCLATAALLCLAMMALARMERAALAVRRVPVRSQSHPSTMRSESSALAADRVSSPGGVTYGPRR